MATHSSVLAWRIPGTVEPGGLSSVGSHRVGHDWSDLACMHALEKEMATHSSVLAWRIPGTEEPGWLLSMGSHRVRHNWSDLAAEEPGGLHSVGSQRVGHEWANDTFTFHRLASEGCKSKSLYFLISLKPVSIPQFLHCIYLFTSLIGFPLFSHQSILLVIARMILPKQTWSYYSEALN